MREKAQTGIETDEALYLNLLKECLTASIYEESSWRVIEARGSLPASGWNIAVAIKNWLRRMIVTQLQKRSLCLVRRNRFNAEEREAGGDWPCFGYTMIGGRGLDTIQRCVQGVLKHQIPGDFIETGAWRGGAAIFMRALLRASSVKDRIVWVADSFQGLPEPKNAEDGWDLSHVNHLKVSLDQVRANFRRFGLLDDQVRFLPGWFRDTLPGAPIKQLALLRLDGDLYSSTMDALSSLYFKVSPGGYVIVDDYFSWPSCKRAVDDFLREHGISVRIEEFQKGIACWSVPASHLSNSESAITIG